MLEIFGIGGLSWQELLLIGLVLLVLFGATRIKTFMRGLGEGIREFKEGLKEKTKEEQQKQDSEK
jgi:sec-independent protein translocase protein TatA